VEFLFTAHLPVILTVAKPSVLPPFSAGRHHDLGVLLPT
jgi:hypothetical protein